MRSKECTKNFTHEFNWKQTHKTRRGQDQIYTFIKIFRATDRDRGTDSRQTIFIRQWHRSETPVEGEQEVGSARAAQVGGLARSSVHSRESGGALTHGGTQGPRDPDGPRHGNEVF